MLLGEALSKEVLEAGNKFENWKQAQIDSLAQLEKCQKLRLWLKDNIKSSQQLKNFVELAGISAGESDDEVSVLLSAKSVSQTLLVFIFVCMPSCKYISTYISICFALSN